MRLCNWILACGMILVSPLALSGCKQHEGDRCQLDSDCEEGLTCCVEEINRLLGGRCFSAGQCDKQSKDSGVKDLGQPIDSGTDATVKKDVAIDQGKDTKPTIDHDLAKDTKPTMDQKATADLKVVDQKVVVDQKPTVDTKPTVDLFIPTEAHVADSLPGN
jgi:hypothetical protein